MTGIALLVLGFVIWGHIAASGEAIVAWLAPSSYAVSRPVRDTRLAPLLTATYSPTPTTTPTIFPVESITPSPTTTSDPFTSPLVPTRTPGPSATSDPFVSPLATRTPTPSATPTVKCPRATAEPLWVEPVISPANRLSQTITVYAGNSEAVTITAESGLFALHGSFGTYQPALVDIDLLPNVTHHLMVYSKVRVVEGYLGCVYGGYTLRTTTDRYGAPLIIEHRSRMQAPYVRWLPSVFGSGPVSTP